MARAPPGRGQKTRAGTCYAVMGIEHDGQVAVAAKVRAGRYQDGVTLIGQGCSGPTPEGAIAQPKVGFAHPSQSLALATSKNQAHDFHMFKIAEISNATLDPNILVRGLLQSARNLRTCPHSVEMFMSLCV